MMKKEPVTVGELIDFLLSREFNRNDIIVMETNERELPFYDIGRSVNSHDGTKLILSRKK